MTDGSGLAARQTANRLWSARPDPLCLCRFTRHVERIRRVPAYGPDPLAWLDAALAIYQSGQFDVLFPTQEQVAVLASVPERLHDGGVVTAVPPCRRPPAWRQYRTRCPHFVPSLDSDCRSLEVQPDRRLGRRFPHT